MDDGFPEVSDEDKKWMLEKYTEEELKRKTYEELLWLLPNPICCLDDIIVSPVIEIKSISFKTNGNDDDNKMYDIYGTIQLIDWEGASFDLYNRKRDNPETISNGGFLTITPPMDRAITATGLAEVHIDLYDANQDGAPFMNSTFLWDPIMGECYGEVREHTQLFDAAEVGSVVIGFITYSHALVCTVDVKFLMDCNIDVYGEIIARAGKFPTILFDRKQNESVKVKYGSNIQLSRHVVVAPASSLSLNIYAKLFNGVTHEKIIEKTTRYGIFTTKRCYIHPRPGDLIKPLVRWTHPSLQPHLFSDVAPTSSEIVPGRPRRNSRYGHKLVEIYSVSIAGHTDEDMDIWGSIEFSPLFEDSISLFNEDKSAPRKLLPYQIVPLKSYTYRLCIPFSLELQLRDGNDRSISEGWVSWNDQTSENYIDLLNEHLCAAVRSASGYYAVIHYSVFDFGIHALVKIYLHGKNSDMKYFNADGSVCAQYSEYDYSTLYQYEYFRKKLFVGKSTDPWLPYPCSSLLISEYSVTVPEGSALMVDVNLKLNYSETLANIGDDGNPSEGSLQPRDSFEEVLEFKYDDIDLTSNNAVFQKEIEGSCMKIVTKVQWMPVR